MHGALARFVSLGVGILVVVCAVGVAVTACSSSTASSSSSSGGACPDAGTAAPDGSCGAITADIERNGGGPGVCSDSTPAVTAKFAKACGALDGCRQCTGCDLDACNKLFGR